MIRFTSDFVGKCPFRSLPFRSLLLCCVNLRQPQNRVPQFPVPLGTNSSAQSQGGSQASYGAGPERSERWTRRSESGRRRPAPRRRVTATTATGGDRTQSACLPCGCPRPRRGSCQTVGGPPGTLGLTPPYGHCGGRWAPWAKRLACPRRTVSVRRRPRSSPCAVLRVNPRPSAAARPCLGSW